MKKKRYSFYLTEKQRNYLTEKAEEDGLTRNGSISVILNNLIKEEQSMQNYRISVLKDWLNRDAYGKERIAELYKPLSKQERKKQRKQQLEDEK